MSAMTIKIKPLSVNECWQGKRFKTPKYKDYERNLLFALRKINIPKGKLKLTINWGFSSKASDWDNPIKPFQDILQTKHEFKDNRIYKAVVEKFDVKKGEEFIEYNIESYEPKDIR